MTDSEVAAALANLKGREHETVVARAADHPDWLITSDDPRQVRRLLKLYKRFTVEGGSFVFKVPVHAVAFRPEAKREGRKLTEAQRTAAVARLTAARRKV